MIEHAAQPKMPLNMHLTASAPYLLNEGMVKDFDVNSDFYAVAGIGFPRWFYNTLEKMGIQHFQCHEFPDHFEYEIEDLLFEDSNPIITTEKDAVKILPLLKQNPDFQREIWVVPVDAVLSSACYETLHQQLKQLGIQFDEGLN